MIVHIPPGTPYMPQYDGWYVTSNQDDALYAEYRGKPAHSSMSLLKADNFRSSSGGFTDTTRSYHLWVWRPGPAENEFGVVSP